MLLMQTVQSYAFTMDGNEFLEMSNKKNAMTNNYLNGYAAGMYDAHEESLTKCVGDQVRMSQLVDSVVAYLKNNPQIRHFPVSYIYTTAIKKQFNCK